MENDESIDDGAAETAEDMTPPLPAELFAKAEEVHARITALREELDNTVFKGLSDDGVVEIGLCGDGRPVSAEIHVEGQDEQKQRLAFDILDALDNVYAARIERLENGLKAIQDETGVGPDFKMPF